MALPFTRELEPLAVVYDCMDELAAFENAPVELVEREAELLARADVVFTGGMSLYEAKRARHPQVHPFPSSVDVAHFKKAREPLEEPDDQAVIPHPRLGYSGVVDERMDLDLIAGIADARPDWQLVIVGPVVKIDEDALPERPNIHYLGRKTYGSLPSYLAGWDIGLVPFAQNEATRFISPTKTPEYLAAGLPVVSTPIADIVHPYGDDGLVAIGADAADFVHGIAAALEEDRDDRLTRVDAFLAETSWDETWARMSELVDRAIGHRRASVAPPPARVRRFDYLVVGAGFAGSTLAERLASDGADVLLVDRRPHVGGNAYDHYDDAGVLVHRYGPHIFHTNSDRVVEYLSRFTDWRPYEHRVLAAVDGQLVPIPINLDTVNRLYGLDLDSKELERFFADRAEPVGRARTSEDVVVGTVGRDLYEKFFRGYTRKQWGLDPSELDASVTSRVPTRTNRDDRYFTDSFQAMPRHGFTRMFENMLDHPGIKILLNTDYREIEDLVPYRRMIYTGPIDEFFHYCYGKLPYRSLEFRFESLDERLHLPVAVVNHPSESVPFTRVTEFKHLTGQDAPRTTLVYEYPRGEGDPYYPVPRPENATLYKQYKELADATPEVEFVGRLATYKYYNMDQVVAQALAVYDRIAGKRPAAEEKREQGRRTPAARALGRT
jgi:UDP-galactopyranose mutase